MKYLKQCLVVCLIGGFQAGCITYHVNQPNESSKVTSETSSSSSVSEISTIYSTESHESSIPETSQVSSYSESQETKVGLVEREILNGDYTSLNGTWTNSYGKQLTFNNGMVTLSGEGLGGETQFSLINPLSSGNLIFLTFDPFVRPNGMQLMIALSGTSPLEGTPEDGTDRSRDRIVMGNNGGAMLFATKAEGGIPDTAYYREY